MKTDNKNFHVETFCDDKWSENKKYYACVYINNSYKDNSFNNDDYNTIELIEAKEYPTKKEALNALYLQTEKCFKEILEQIKNLY